MVNVSLLYTLLAASAASLGVSLMGNFVILLRLALAADVLSHIALPGIAIALGFGINPLLGGFVFLVFAAFLLWRLEGRTRLPLDTLVGIIFVVSLAIGALLFKGRQEELLEALFGSLAQLTVLDVWIAAAVGLLLLGFVVSSFRPFVLSLVSPDLARVQGINAGRMRLFLLLFLALAVAVGIKITGVLLIGALLILPAATAQQVSRGLTRALVLSVFVGISGSIAGILAGARTGLEAGPLVILILAALFVLSGLVALFSRRTYAT